jgi:hypothetical protein
MESIKPCAARRVNLNYAFNDQNGGDGEIRIAGVFPVKKALLTHTR